MNESKFVKKVHRLLPDEIFIWKIADPFQGGVPDAQYFGQTGQSLFVEYKYIKKRPVRPTTVVKPNLSVQQINWLNLLYERQQNVFVVLGHSSECFIFSTPETWEHGAPNQNLESKTLVELVEAYASVLGVSQ